MAFSNNLFPINIAMGSQGGPRHASALLEQPSGQRKVTTRWNGALRRWDAKYGIRKQLDLYTVYEFVLAHNGAEHTFRWHDHLDFTSNPTDGSSTVIAGDDQLLGVGDGTQIDFQLKKTYTKGNFSRSRVIGLPVSSPAPLVEVNGTPMTEGTDYTINYLTGVITFAVAPGVGEEVRAGFHFHCHGQFSQEVDQWLNIAITGFKAGEIPSITIDEVPNDAANSTNRGFGGSTVISLTADAKISLNTGEVILVNDSPGTSFAVWMPNPKGMGSGKLYFQIVNIGSNGFIIRDHTGVSILTVAAGATYFVSLALNTDGTKSWIFH